MVFRGQLKFGFSDPKTQSKLYIETKFYMEGKRESECKRCEGLSENPLCVCKALAHVERQAPPPPPRSSPKDVMYLICWKFYLLSKFLDFFALKQ